MKITQISTTDSGGAGIAALRLHNGLLANGADSNFLSLWQQQPTNPEHKFVLNPVAPTLTLQNRIQRKLGKPILQEEKNKQLLNGKTGNYEIFSFPRTDYAVEQHPAVQQSDIINLHWVAGMINYPSFLKINKPIVWTLHDCNPFMGGFHYPADLERNRAQFGNLEQQLLSVKQTVYNERKASTTIVTPSSWLGGLAKASSAFKQFDVRVIPNSVNTSVFKPHDKTFARSVFNIPPNKQVILFVSENIHNHRKGLDLLLEAINTIQSGDIILMAAGNAGAQPSPHITYTGAIHDERLMSLLYSAADVFILPSREDNLPNVTLESAACGTPIIAFNTGGIPEVVQHGFNGILASQISANALSLAITQFLNGEFVFNREQIRTDAVKRFDTTVQVTAYTTLYRELLDKK